MLFSGAIYAQMEITQELEKFTEIKAFDRIEVQLVKSNGNKVVITGDDREEVSIVNKDGLLKIRMELGNNLEGGDILVKVYFTEELTLLDSNEDARITSEETLTVPELRVAVQEAGKVSLKINVGKLDVKSTSGGEVVLSGNAKSQEVLANAGGKVYNEKLITGETTVTVNAGGRADINASEKVIAKVRAGGTITIFGNPKQVDKNKVFGGKITVKD
jgi:hypothetical protein